MTKVSEYRRHKKRHFYLSIIPLALFVVSVGFLAYWFWGRNLLLPAALNISVDQPNFTISVDGQAKKESTTSIANISASTHTIKISQDHPFYTFWSQAVQTTAGFETYVHRQIGPSPIFSAGEVVYFEKGQTGLLIASRPDKSTVTIDSQSKGQTPLFLADITPGSFTVTVSAEGFVSRKITVKVKEGFTTHLSMDLYKIPLPQNPSVLKTKDVLSFPHSSEVLNRWEWRCDDTLRTSSPEFAPVSKMSLYDLSTDDELMYNDSRIWIRGLYFYDIFYQQKSDIQWHYLIDREGHIYEGQAGGADTVIKGSLAEVKIAYLGKKGEPLTKEAETAYLSLEKSTDETPKYQAVLAENPTFTFDLKANTTQEITVTYRNSGAATWYDKEPRQVLLKPDSTNSRFYTPTDWLSNGTVKSLPTTYVPYDNNVQFTFTITIPNQMTERTETFSLYVQKGQDWQKIDGSSFTVKTKIQSDGKPTVLIKPTGTGYLNVRSAASFSAGIIDRATPGERYVFLDETSGWIKIQLKNGKEGWVSATYVQK